MDVPSRPWPQVVVECTILALEPHADTTRAAGAFAYMKGVAPFLGISAPDRRRYVRTAWAALAPPTSDELGSAALALMGLREREFHYAAYDLIDQHVLRADADFLPRFGERLLTTSPWWDTVDGLVNAAVSPLSRRFELNGLIDAWSASGDRWLIRAAIGHQRGWKHDTDTTRVLGLCDRHWAEREFFIAKAIGWALRDLARLEPRAVEDFLAAHPAPNRVARREAERGLGNG